MHPANDESQKQQEYNRGVHSEETWQEKACSIEVARCLSGLYPLRKVGVRSIMQVRHNLSFPVYTGEG